MQKKLSDIPFEEIYDRNDLTSRESILRSELKDFKKLEDLNFLKNLKNIIVERYKLERRNSFKSDVDKEFSILWDSVDKLYNFEESKLSFYKKRIIEIKSELKNYEG